MESSTCALRPPPVDPIFTILVALLTLIISNIPIALIQYILLEYCSKSPGLKEEVEIDGIHRKSTVPLGPSAAATQSEGLNKDTPAPTRTEFGDIIRKRVSEGSGSFISTTDQAQYAFAGTLDRTVLLCTVLYCVLLYFAVLYCTVLFYTVLY